MNCLSGCKLFGAYRTAISIKDSAVLIHSIIGCNWGTLLFHTVSKPNDVRQASSVIFEDEVINGGETQLKRAVECALSTFNPEILFVLTGCVPEIINDNADKVVRTTGNGRVQLIQAAGFTGSSKSGIKESMETILSRMQKIKTDENSVNIIGLFSDDFKIDADLNYIRRLVPDQLKVNAVFPYDTMRNIINIPNASLNIVFEGYEDIAKFLSEKFGTPYIVSPYPYGMNMTKSFLDGILSSFNLKYDITNSAAEINLMKVYDGIKPYVNDLYGMPVSVIGDAVRNRSMKHFLEEELGMTVENCIDRDSCNADDLDRDVSSSNSIMIFGSSFEKNIAERLSIPFLQFSYPVFDRISISNAGYAGFEGTANLVEDIINEIKRS
jgi:nitrogenase molybdenum-iron protein beta chain